MIVSVSGHEATMWFTMLLILQWVQRTVGTSISKIGGTETKRRHLNDNGPPASAEVKWPRRLHIRNIRAWAAGGVDNRIRSYIPVYGGCWTPSAIYDNDAAVVVWRRYHRCPAVNPDEMTPLPNEPLCGKRRGNRMIKYEFTTKDNSGFALDIISKDIT